MWVFVACALGLAACQFDEMGGATETPSDRQNQPAAPDVRVMLVDGAPDRGDDLLTPGVAVPSADAAGADSSVDTLAPDGTIDTVAPDQSVDTSADQGVVTCTAKYGSAAGFQLCSATLKSCTFYVRTNENTCANLCGALGGQCLGGRDNSGSQRCVASSQSSSCKWVHYDQICTCSRR